MSNGQKCITTPDEMIAHMFGPIDGRRNEASMLWEIHVE